MSKKMFFKNSGNKGIIIHLTAEDVVLSSGFVTQMNDISGNGNHLASVQGIAPTLPTIIENHINGYPAVSIDAGNYLFRQIALNELSQDENHYTFMVFKAQLRSGGGYNSFFIRGVLAFSAIAQPTQFQQFYKNQAGSNLINYWQTAGLNSTIAFSSWSTNTMIYVNDKSVASNIYKINNLETTRTGTQIVNNRGLYIGNWNGNFCKMQLAEFGIIDKSTTTLNLVDFENNLKTKYGII